jgi:hypothetical protein
LAASAARAAATAHALATDLASLVLFSDAT